METILESQHIVQACEKINSLWNKLSSDTDTIFKNFNHFELLLIIVGGYILCLVLCRTVSSPRFQRMLNFMCCKRRNNYEQYLTEEEKEEAKEQWLRNTKCDVKRVYSELPMQPLKDKEFNKLIKELDEQNGLTVDGKIVAKNKYKSVEEMNSEVEKLACKTSGTFFKSNPLHYDIFGGNCQMEAEIIKMCVDMYKGDKEACGILDSSEADCIRNALFAYRNWGKEQKGITKPNVIAPQTFDPSLERSGDLIDVEIRRIPVNQNAQINPRDISLFVDENTVAIFFSYPDGVFGVFDPVKPIAEYCNRHGIGFHIDCNYSSFLLGPKEVHFGDGNYANFLTEGVTTIGVSLSKYGLGFPGTACLIYRTRVLRKYQYYAHFNWNGGMYASPNLSGSRYASATSASWVRILGTGKDNYIQKANDIIFSTNVLRKDLEENKEYIEILTQNNLSIDI